MTWLSRMVRYMGVLGDPQLRPGTIEGLPPFALRKAIERPVLAGSGLTALRGWLVGTGPSLFVGSTARFDPGQTSVCGTPDRIQLFPAEGGRGRGLASERRCLPMILDAAPSGAAA